MHQTIDIKVFSRLLVLVTLLCSSTCLVWAQNLIPNPRFRNLVDCDFKPRRNIQDAPPWYGMGRFGSGDGLAAQCVWPRIDTNTIIINSTYATVDGILKDQAGYAVTPLLQPLQAEKYYWMNMFSRLDLRSVNNQQLPQERGSYGANFSTDRPNKATNTMILIADGVPSLLFPNLSKKTNSSVGEVYTWQTLSSCFRAEGGERYVTIGDYRHPAYTNRDATISFTDLSLVVMPDRINLGPDTSICAGQRIQLNAHFPFPATYRWQDGSTDSTMTITRSGLYSLTITCPCRTYTDTIRVAVRDPLLELGADTSVCAGQPIILSAAPGYDRYRWQDGSTMSTLIVNKSGVYSVEVEQFNCLARDSVRVLPSGDCCELYIPTAFSPNADGVNDAFAVITGCSDVIQEPELLIYNRWGETIFRTPDLTTGWNGYKQGTPCPVGKYTWQLRYALPKRRSLIRQQQRGTVLLVR